ncbi:MAG: hypothetical protein P4M01_00730 [Acidobacteriota bacterium]|nr:hypothetical protein [Acidobacteriota bacterium]
MRKLLVALGLAALAFLSSCGNDRYTYNTPGNPSGGNNAGYSSSSLNGSYVFTASGVYANGISFSTAGNFIADGSGNVTSGVRDVYSDGGQKVQEESLTGTYSVNEDGRGQLQLKGASGATIFRFVLHSASEGVFFQYSGAADATGRFVLRPAETSNAVRASYTYVLRLDGEDSSGAPYGAVGLLNLTGNDFVAGTFTGTVDQNDSGTYSAQLAASGTLTAPDTHGRGTASITIGSNTATYVFYWVSVNEIELLRSDGTLQYGSGYQQTAVSGSTAAFTGGQVFSLSGYLASGNHTYPIAETGYLSLNGSGTLASAVEDSNVGGNYTGNVSFSGTNTADATGRWTATLSGAQSTNLVGYQVSASKSMVLSYNTGATILETGVLQAQTSGLTAASITGNYAVDLSGYSYYAPGNVESTANYLADGAGNLSGTLDSQTPGFYNTDVSQTGVYSVSSSGRSTATFGAVPAALYVVDATTAYILSSDGNRLYQGTMVKQQ